MDQLTTPTVEFFRQLSDSFIYRCFCLYTKYVPRLVQRVPWRSISFFLVPRKYWSLEKSKWKHNLFSEWNAFLQKCNPLRSSYWFQLLGWYRELRKSSVLTRIVYRRRQPVTSTGCLREHSIEIHKYSVAALRKGHRQILRLPLRSGDDDDDYWLRRIVDHQVECPSFASAAIKPRRPPNKSETFLNHVHLCDRAYFSNFTVGARGGTLERRISKRSLIGFKTLSKYKW